MIPARRRHRLLAVVAAISLTLVAVGCGGDDDSSSENQLQTTTSAPSTTVEADGSTDTTAGGGNGGDGAAGRVDLHAGPGPFESVADPDRDGSLDGVEVSLQEVATLDEPTSLVVRPGDDDHLWASERAGTVRRLTRDGGTYEADGEPALDISDDTTTESERGLLSIAFSADGDTIYVSHTNAGGDTRLDAYAMSGDAIDTSSKETLLAVDQPFSNHNGGDVQLGPDGMLWFGLGDGGAGNDPGNRAQNPDELLGKVLRIDPTKPADGKPYSIPEGNPFADGGGAPEIAIMGVRNPWRFSFDRENDDLWIGDVGQDQVEEVDHLPIAQALGVNLGWSGFEGTEAHLDGEGRRPAESVPPVFEYTHEDGGCSITGGYVYRGRAIEALEGAYLFADYCAAELRALVLGDDGQVADERVLTDTESPISFAEDQDGEVYVLSQSGAVSRIVPA